MQIVDEEGPELKKQESDMYVVWKWGDRWVNHGKLVDDMYHVLLVEIVDVDGERHHLALPKGSFKFKFFSTEKEAKEFLIG